MAKVKGTVTVRGKEYDVYTPVRAFLLAGEFVEDFIKMSREPKADFDTTKAVGIFRLMVEFVQITVPQLDTDDLDFPEELMGVLETVLDFMPKLNKSAETKDPFVGGAGQEKE